MSEPKRPHCGRCRHAYTTWDGKFPHGCRAHGFKSAQSPSFVVQQSSGMECQLFQERLAEAAEPQTTEEDTARVDRFERRR
ncbi:MAG: hypothetical protein IT285_08260 [Bdellovibrionales bacterium]|nr:hypothetical protein [Bdellovibrionales bacterium]